MTKVNSNFQRRLTQSSPAELLRRKLVAALDFYPGFNITVIAFAIGIGTYFAWPYEPSGQIVLGLSGFTFALWVVFQRYDWTATGYVWLLCALVLGFGRSVWHVKASDAPRLPQQERTYRIEGWISAIEKSGKSERYVVDLISVENMRSDRMPQKLRIRVTKRPDPPIPAGATINWLVASKAPPSAAVPGGYHPGQAAYFKGIGGFGFGYGAPEIQSDAELGHWDRMRRGIIRWRYGLADRIMAAAPAETAGLQSALMTGVRRFIPEDQTENLRIAGLAHILAISGLHMALLAGGTYSGFALGLACILPLSRRYDVRKFAALAAIGAATFYLVDYFSFKSGKFDLGWFPDVICGCDCLSRGVSIMASAPARLCLSRPCAADDRFFLLSQRHEFSRGFCHGRFCCVSFQPFCAIWLCREFARYAALLALCNALGGGFTARYAFGIRGRPALSDEFGVRANPPSSRLGRGVAGGYALYRSCAELGPARL